jgi:sugar-specific transcriptional regulator TrmB
MNKHIEMNEMEERFVPVMDEIIEIENDFDPVEASEFPINVLPNVVAEFVKEVSRLLSIPYEYTAIPSLVALSTAIGNNFELEFNRTPSQALALKPIHNIQKKENENIAKLKREYEKAIKNKEESIPNPPPPKREYYTTDVTVEKLIDMMEKNPKGLIIASDEFMKFYKSLNGYKNGGGDLEQYLSAWSNSPIKVDRLNRETIGVDSPYLNIVGNMTPSSLGTITEGDNMDNGFLHRILFSCPLETEMTRTSERGIDEEIEKSYHNLIDALHSIEDEVAYQMSNQAKNIYLQYESYLSKQAGLDERKRALFSKIKMYSLRFALLLNACKFVNSKEFFTDKKVDANIMQDAIEMAEYFRKQTKKLYHAMSETKDDKYVSKFNKLASKLKKESRTTITKRDIQRGFGLSKDELDPIITKFTELEYIKLIDEKQSRGGVVCTYEINFEAIICQK